VPVFAWFRAKRSRSRRAMKKPTRIDVETKKDRDDQAAREKAIRRPIRARQTKWAHLIASGLARIGVTPNQISIASVLAAGAAGISLCAGARVESTGLRIALPVLAAAFVQLRLLCNLFDGMVAVEGGRKTKSGEVFNDFPDRIADPLVLVGAGYAISGHGIELGWAAGLLAVMTAYVRVLGGSMGVTQSFMGPMAKQHRMAVMTVACVAQSVEAAIGASPRILTIALLIIIAGCVVTVCRRLLRIVREAETR
jgi:phosphatidylglycerophosphate synthase